MSSTIKQEADTVYNRYCIAKAEETPNNPLPASFIFSMRDLGYPAINASLIFNVINIAQKEIKQELRDKIFDIFADMGEE